LKVTPTALVALIAVFVAFQQYNVARGKLKLDLFEKRYAIFLDTWKILSATVSSGTLPQASGLGTRFNNFIPQAAFLFGPEVEAYLNKAASQWAFLYGLQSKANTASGQLSPSELARQAELEQWFFHEAEQNAKRLFRRYLSFETWR